MVTKRKRKNVAISLGLAIFAIWLVRSSAFAAENVSFRGTTKIASGDFVTLTGKLTKAQGHGPFPAVALMHGCGGINKANDTWADRLASWGYVAFQVDSFGPRGEKEICAKTMAIPFHVRSQDAYDVKACLSGLPLVDRNRIAVMGWSHGGVTTLSTVSNSNYAPWATMAKANASRKQEEPFQAAIAFYPYCQGDLGDSNAPLLILAGELDEWCPAALCQKNTPSGKVAHEIILKVYPGAYHGFDMEGIDLVREGHHVLYNPQALADSIVQVKGFLAMHLK